MDTQNLKPVLQKIATGPHLSKDLSEQEAYDAMQSILRGEVHDVQSAIFFIALRMKRETADELVGVFRAILDDAPCVNIKAPSLVTLADQYAGYARGLPASPFIPAVLSALGVPSVTHSPTAMSPKYGLTPLSVLKAAGVVPHSSLENATSTLEKNAGWVLMDQSVVTPALTTLNALRDLMVKRPFLSTIECCVQPFQAERTNTLVTGYVHKAYPPIYAMCADVANFSNAVFVRGVEGGVVPSLAQVSRFFPWQSDDRTRTQPSSSDHASGQPMNTIKVTPFDDIVLNEEPIDPKALRIEQSERTVPWPDCDVSDHAAAANECAEMGMNALQGEAGLMRDAIRLGAAVAYRAHQLSSEQYASASGAQNSLNTALESVDAVLRAGEAWRRFEDQRKI